MAIEDRSWSRDFDKTKIVGRAYLNGAKKRSTWLNFHHGLAAVHEMNAKNDEANVLTDLKKHFPTPQSAISQADDVRRDLAIAKEMRDSGVAAAKEEAGEDEKLFKKLELAAKNKSSDYITERWLRNTRNKATVLEAVLQGASQWEQVEQAITNCPTPGNEEDMTSACCAADGQQKREKTRRNDETGKMEPIPDYPCNATINMEGPCDSIYGLKMKGMDMAMLLQGCEVPVPDKWMIWHMSEEAEPGRDRLPRPGTRVENQSEKKTQSAINVATSKVQADPVRYDKYRKAIIKEARGQGLTVGEFHTGVWLDLVTCASADGETGECRTGDEDRSRAFIKELFE